MISRGRRHGRRFRAWPCSRRSERAVTTGLFPKLILTLALQTYPVVVEDGETLAKGFYVTATSTE